MDRLLNRHDRIAITGIGMITPLGISTHECWENMLRGRSGIRRITRFDPSDCLTQIGGELPDEYFDYERANLPKRVYKRSILPSRLAILTAKQALDDANLDPARIDPYKAGVITGCGGSSFGDEIIYASPQHKRFPFSHDMLNALSACVSIDFGFRGPSFNVATACASGAFAVGLAYDYVRRHGDVCIAMGLDTMLHRDSIDGFNSLMALSELNDFPQKASRPFDKNRTGFVISEGACALVLESYHHAVGRGARIYALVAGHAATSEAFNIIAPEPHGAGMAQTMEMALANAAVSKREIGYISAHGTSTPHNDRAETKAIKLVFGEAAYGIPISSQKSMLGHTIGGAGAIEAGVTALSLYHQVLTPTINYEETDPDCDLDYVPNKARPAEALTTALSNSFGFGGHNSTIVFQKFEGR